MKLLPILILVAAICVFAQYVSFPGSVAPTGGPSSYSGPGDIVSSANVAWWGLRAYSLAKAGTKAVNVCNTGDAACADVNTLADGSFDVATAAGAPLNCGGSGGTCTIKVFYDQTAGGNCGGSCDLVRSTIPQRPVLTFNCIGSLPCTTWAGSQWMITASFTTPIYYQPLSVSVVAEQTGNLGAQQTIIGSWNSPRVGFMGSAGAVFGWAGAGANSAATDGAPHAIQFLSSNFSLINVDGVATTGAGGYIGLHYYMTMGADDSTDSPTEYLTGHIMEGGWWASDTSAHFSALNRNQHSYWGF
jgi:hypothetical protein